MCPVGKAKYYFLTLAILVVCLVFTISNVEQLLRISVLSTYRNGKSVKNVASTSASSCSNNRNVTILLDPARHNLNVLEGLFELPNSTVLELSSTCTPTCLVRIIPGCPYWELETLDCRKKSKTVGGDEFYLTYSDRDLAVAARQSKEPFWMRPASAVAWLVDQNNGRYRIDFQASPLSPQIYSGTGVFSVYFQYTCGIGRMAYPLKETWPHGGQTIAWARSEELPLVPPIRPFELPSERPILFNFSTIVPVGDSLLQQFLAPYGISFDNINMALNSTTLPLWKQQIHNKLVNIRHPFKKAAVIAGSCAWDIFENQNVSTTAIDGSHEWHDHRKALADLFAYVHEDYPETTMFWKSCAGFHIHIPYLFKNHEPAQRMFMQSRLKHMSTSRALSMHQVQKEVIEQAMKNNPGKLHFLDIYPAYYLSADRTRAGDGRHYVHRLNDLASGWFANESRVETLWRERQPNSNALPLIVEYKKGWLEWVNAALFAKVTGRRLQWDREHQLGFNASKGVLFEGNSTHFLGRGYLSKFDRTSISGPVFVSSLYDDTASGSEHLYGMILFRCLQDLSDGEQSGLPLPLNRPTIAIAPFADLRDVEKVDRCLDAELSRILRVSNTETEPGGCEIVFPSLQWAAAMQATVVLRNCTVRVESIDQPHGALRMAAQLVESSDLSSLILSCSASSSNLFLQLLNYMLQNRARQRGLLPVHGGFPYCCLQ